MTKEELKNYEPKGDLKGFPKEIIARMLDCQEEQGNKRDISVFEEDKCSLLEVGGFNWDETKEKFWFWEEVIRRKNFDSFFKQFLEEVIRENNFSLFFEKYPKQDKSINIVRVENKENNSTPNLTYAENSCDIVIDTEDNSQEFKVGDKVIDIISGRIGKVTYIDALNMDNYPIFVNFNDEEGVYLTLNGRGYDTDKHPRLLHYRDDYNYDVIDFNNLPKRQEPKRWRTKEGGCYYFVGFDNECWFFSDDTKDDYDHFDNDNYNSGNYFSTEVEAEIIAQKMNTYFKQLIQEEHEHKKRY